MRATLVLLATALVLPCLPQRVACQESGDADAGSTGYELTAAALVVDLRREPPGACAIVEIRNRSRDAIRRVEVFCYSRELADGIVYTEISSESLDSPAPIADALFGAPQVVAEGEGGTRKLLFKLARDLERAEATWVLVQQADRGGPLATAHRTGAELTVESPPFARDLGKLVIGLVSDTGDTMELKSPDTGHAAGSAASEGGILMTNQIASLSRLLGAAVQLYQGAPVSSWPAAAYFDSTPAGTTRTAKAAFVSLEGGLDAPDRGWILAAATLSGGAVVVAILVAWGRRSSSQRADG